MELHNSCINHLIFI